MFTSSMSIKTLEARNPYSLACSLTMSHSSATLPPSVLRRLLLALCTPGIISSCHSLAQAQTTNTCQQKYPERRSAWQMLTNILKLWPCHATHEYINRINYIVCKQCFLAFVLGRCGWDITTPSGNFHHWHSQTRSFKPAAMTTICTFQESVVKTCHKMVYV